MSASELLEGRWCGEATHGDELAVSFLAFDLRNDGESERRSGRSCCPEDRTGLQHTIGSLHADCAICRRVERQRTALPVGRSLSPLRRVDGARVIPSPPRRGMLASEASAFGGQSFVAGGVVSRRRQRSAESWSCIIRARCATQSRGFPAFPASGPQLLRQRLAGTTAVLDFQNTRELPFSDSLRSRRPLVYSATCFSCSN